MLLLMMSAVPAAVVQCPGLPPAQDNAAVSGWNSSCSNATAGSSCSVACGSNAIGSGYQASCTINGTWSVNGSCARELLPVICNAGQLSALHNTVQYAAVTY